MLSKTRIGLYGSYLLSMASIGFILPFMPLYLRQEGLSDRQIGFISMLAALSGLLQFPVGVLSDRLKSRKIMLVIAAALLCAATYFIPAAHHPLWLGLLVILFAENGLCRAVIESLSGAEAAAQAAPGRIGAALGLLRFCKPLGIVFVAMVTGYFAESHGVGAMLVPLMFLQSGALFCALLLPSQSKGPVADHFLSRSSSDSLPQKRVAWFRDPALCVFVLAMVLFHVANAPGGTYLGLFLKQDLGAQERVISYAFVISMVAWMLVVVPGGRLADRLGTRPLLILCWAVMALRLGLIALARSAWEVVAIQFLDGFANGLFAVLAAAWVTERFNDSRRVGEAQVIVGTSLVLGSGIGPACAGWLIESLGYRGTFGVLAGVGVLATLIVALFVPETVTRANRTSVETDNPKEVPMLPDSVLASSDLNLLPKKNLSAL
jgi:MFS family permease